MSYNSREMRMNIKKNLILNVISYLIKKQQKIEF